MDVKLNLPKLVLVSGAVWLPIVILGATYGAVYAIRNAHANHAQTVYTQKVQACDDKTRSDNAAALARGQTSNGVEVCQHIDNGIAHGWLGFPVFEVVGIPDNNGNYP